MAKPLLRNTFGVIRAAPACRGFGVQQQVDPDGSPAMKERGEKTDPLGAQVKILQQQG